MRFCQWWRKSRKAGLPHMDRSRIWWAGRRTRGWWDGFSAERIFMEQYPCHRVVNSTGRLVPGWTEQGELLRQEGVILKDDAHVDLKKYRWEPGES